jgi:Leucine-rich repeat (LRR) protein
LSSLEYLKLNDSIISTFRDIGTSFKNVRVLHIGRCELKEVQGIQAFEQLEELYISYNEIDELFDIGFLEHLSVLDFEGNNVKDMDQLFYLKRCRKLTHLNLKYNPVQTGMSIGCAKDATQEEKIAEYYNKIKDNVPLIEELDDEPITSTFFEDKL